MGARRDRKRTILATLILGVAATLPGVAALPASAAATGPAAVRPPAVAASPALGDFGAYVATVAPERFPASFSGAVRHPDGTVDVYAVMAKAAPLRQFLRTVGAGSRTPYRVLPSPRSAAQMDATMIQLGAAWVERSGITVTLAEPNAATGAIAVTTMPPTPLARRVVANAATAADRRPDADTYAGAAQRVLSAHLPGVVVASTAGTVAQVASRRVDARPFTSGDSIESNDTAPGFIVQCTTGFPLISNADGSMATTTAAHCGAGHWLVNGATYEGAVTAATRREGGNVDSEAMPTSVRGGIWGGAPGEPAVRYPIVSQQVPPVGAPITWDGSNTLEVRNVAVLANDACARFEAPVNYMCHLVESPSGNPVVSQPGDSGGPVFQHTCPTCTTVSAIATIVGGGGGRAYAGRVGLIEAALNARLY